MSAATVMSLDVQTAALAIIEQAILDHPRSAQAEIGASEIGVPCLRKLGHKLAHTPSFQPPRAAWRPTVGTAVHAWLQLAFDTENAKLGWDRWLTETPVSIGMLTESRVLPGNCDLFDRMTGTVLDWKIPGVTTIKKAKSARSPGEQYRVQAHLYGTGWRNAGFEVNTVAIYYLPAAGELADGYYWSEPYDAAVGEAALTRARALLTGADGLGWNALLPLLPVTEDHCQYCPHWNPASTDPATSCPGVPIAAPTIPSLPFGRVAPVPS